MEIEQPFLINRTKTQEEEEEEQHIEVSNILLDQEGKSMIINAQQPNQFDEENNLNMVNQIEQNQNTNKMYQFSLVIIILMVPFFLLSISLHAERVNNSYSEFFRYSYVLMGFSATIVLAFLIGVWFITTQKLLILIPSLVVSTFSQVCLITFFQTLTTNNEYKEVFVCTSYFISFGLALFALSYLSKDFNKILALAFICLLFILALGILIWKLKQTYIIFSALLGAGFIYGTYGFSQDEKELTFGICFLRGLRGWMLLIPFIVLFTVMLIFKAYIS